MPKARRQKSPSKTKKPAKKVTKKAAKSTGGIRDRVTPVSEVPPTGIKINTYGRGKTGKTRFACTFPKPALLIATEDGTKSVASVEGVDYIRIRASEDISEVSNILVEDGYRSGIVDHASGLQDIIMAEILGLKEMPIQKAWGTASREQWQAGAAQIKERLWEILSLSESHGINTVIIAHERDFKGEGESEFPTVGSALMPSVCNWLNGACDYICQTFIRDEMKTVKQKISGEIVEFEEKTGESEYCLRTGPHSVFMTGFRLPEGNSLPDAIVDPTYEKMMEIIRP